MLRSVLIAFAFSAVIACGYFLARMLDEASRSFVLPLPGAVEGGVAEGSAEGGNKRVEPEGVAEAADSAGRSWAEEALDAFLSEPDRLRALSEMRQRVDSASQAEREALLVEAMARDLEEASVVEVARAALQSIAAEDPALARGLLGAFSSAEKERLATSLVRGWASSDVEAAWNWIGVAWADEAGRFIDRRMQNTLFHAAVDTLLTEAQDYNRAAIYASSAIEPDLRRELARLIARRVVSDNPAAALQRIDFQSEEFIDAAIMEAVVDEWAMRDPVGAQQWVLANEDMVPPGAVTEVAKRLLLEQAGQELVGFHAALKDGYKRDLVAGQATRLLARRASEASVQWLHAIESPEAQRDAFLDALYEIGHENLDATMGYVDLAYGEGDPNRPIMLMAALESWVEVDAEQVADYLDSGRSGLSRPSAESLRDLLGLQPSSE